MRIGFLDTTHESLPAHLERAGHTTQDIRSIPPNELDAILKDLEGLVVRSSKVDPVFLQRCPKLRFVARVGSGLENIDQGYCRKNGIHVLNSPEGNRDGVGESCVMLLLAMMKMLVAANSAVRGGTWPREELRGTDLRGKTVGIIGYGNMGSAFAEKLRGFSVRILAYDKYRSGFARAGLEECPLEQLMRESDVISMHLPLNEETRYFADRDFFLRIGRPIWFLNTSRGGVVDTRALLDAVDHGRVIAAGLDVVEFETEQLTGLDTEKDPVTQQRLLAHPRVLMTPHIAGVTHEGKHKMAEFLASKILRLFPHGKN